MKITSNLVPISHFNKGKVAKIFEKLHSKNKLIVLKNNKPYAIILSPKEYSRLTEIEENYFLLLEANNRIESNKDKPTLSFESVISNLGISENELSDMENVDIEWDEV